MQGDVAVSEDVSDGRHRRDVLPWASHSRCRGQMTGVVRKLNAVQRHRQRVAMGRAVLSVEVDFNGLSAALIDAGFLCERDCDDR